MARDVMREDRLKHVLDGPSGASRDPANLKYWSDRAEANSKIAPRARSGEMRLPDTDSGSGVPWKNSHKGDMRATAKADKNDVGASFMPGTRRTQS